MKNRFEIFMPYPYYREMYENAPTERLKRWFRRTWGETATEPSNNPDTPLTREEVEYLAKYAVGGMEKAFFKKLLSNFTKRILRSTNWAK